MDVHTVVHACWHGVARFCDEARAGGCLHSAAAAQFVPCHVL
jgi:hypothetical protein